MDDQTKKGICVRILALTLIALFFNVQIALITAVFYMTAYYMEN